MFLSLFFVHLLRFTNRVQRYCFFSNWLYTNHGNFYTFRRKRDKHVRKAAFGKRRQLSRRKSQPARMGSRLEISMHIEIVYIVFFLRANFKYIGLRTLYIALFVENNLVTMNLPLFKIWSNHKMYFE